MKRALLGQMTREWKNNIWLVVELSVVALAIWAIMTLLWVTCKGLFQPRGFTPEDVYSIDVKSIPESSPYFLPEYKDKYFEDRNELVRRLRRNPNVAFVSLHNNFAPYEYNYSGNAYNIEGWPDSIGYGGNLRVGEPDIIKVMDIKSVTGKSQDELMEMLRRGEFLLSAHDALEKEFGPMTQVIGKHLYISDHPDKKWRIGDIVQRVRRSDYEYTPNGVIIMPFSNINEQYADILVKVKPGKAKDFEKDFSEDVSLSKLRNVYLSNLKSLVQKGKSLHREIEINIRIMVAICFFLLITIFLGLLGSFWFRVQQRVSEIAIRKTFGATDGDLFRRILGEGMILLLTALLFISACIWPFLHEVGDYLGENWWVFLALQGITAGVMSIGIILSLWYPAWKAMKIEPAVAVKED